VHFAVDGSLQEGARVNEPSDTTKRFSEPSNTSIPTAAGNEEDSWEQFHTWVKNSADDSAKEHGTYLAAATHYERMHERLGIALVILSATISGSLIETFGGGSDAWQNRLTAVLSIVATVVAGIQGFIKPSERARRFRVTARQYLDLSGQSMAEWFQLEFGSAPHRVTEAIVRDWLQLERQNRKIGARAPSLPWPVQKSRKKAAAVEKGPAEV
jgi:hypothetical protein